MIIVYPYLSLPLFLFVRGEVLPATFSPPHLIVFSTLLCLLSSSSSNLSPLLPSSHLSHSPHISALASLVSSYPAHIGPNSAALFGSLSSAILSTCPVHCNLLHASLSVKLLCTPVSSLNSILLLLFFVPSCFRTLAAFVVVVRSVPMFPFRTGMPV